MFAQQSDITTVPTITSAHAWTFFVVFGSFAAIILLAGLIELIRTRSALPLYCLLGSVLCNPVEPIWDALGKLRFHKGNIVAWTQFRDLPVPIEYPWWALFVYTFFTGVTFYVFFQIFRRGTTWKLFWWCVAGQAVMNFVLEGYIITSAYDYYGEQPWRIGSDFPLWWVFANFGELLGGALLVLAVRQFGRRAYPLAIILIPASFAGWELWAGWPVYAAINSDAGAVVQNLAAVVTAALALGTLYVVGRGVTATPRVARTELSAGTATSEV
ncbi:hypothetical protein HFP15_15355 [Amycolatopsis sp. K13G38]|uniref:Uncharacterized protein n=1 Tax=Amycolatopsis acididurans TaxID=2724524 RepID=A0ABX1J5Q7_9PSEU|nr:hypothetical protein [Amycolatopsis acididurans]NKQ54264.1 hypothetical protein [Amycolatopsis acididurans]